MEEMMRIQDAHTDEAENAYSLAHYWPNGDDNLLTCPYDMEHKIRQYRMAGHLLKCQKNHPDAEVFTCPYNATHVLPIRFYHRHVTGCPDFRSVDQEQQLPSMEDKPNPRMLLACMKPPAMPRLSSRVKYVDTAPDASHRDGPSAPKIVVSGGYINYRVLNKAGRLPPLVLKDDTPDNHVGRPLRELMSENQSNEEGLVFTDNSIVDGGADLSMYATGGVPATEEDI